MGPGIVKKNVCVIELTQSSSSGLCFPMGPGTVKKNVRSCPCLGGGGNGGQCCVGWVEQREGQWGGGAQGYDGVVRGPSDKVEGKIWCNKNAACIPRIGLKLCSGRSEVVTMRGKG